VTSTNIDKAFAEDQQKRKQRQRYSYSDTILAAPASPAGKETLG
jgi:hypothetical protein